MSRDEGSRGKPFTILLVLLVAVGLGNYFRNWTAEKNRPGARVFSIYDDVQLASLAEGYQSESETLEKRTSETSHSGDAEVGGTLFSEKLDAFEKVQRSAGQMRELSAQLAELEDRIRDIEKEQNYRQHHAGDRLLLHWKRLIGV